MTDQSTECVHQSLDARQTELEKNQGHEIGKVSAIEVWQETQKLILDGDFTLAERESLLAKLGHEPLDESMTPGPSDPQGRTGREETGACRDPDERLVKHPGLEGVPRPAFGHGIDDDGIGL